MLSTNKRGQITIFIILGLILLLFTASSIYIYSYVKTSQSQSAVMQAGQKGNFKNLIGSQTRCIDNTEFGFCSKTTPLYCNNGFLEFDCQSCSCNSDEICRPSGECIKNLTSAKDQMSVFFVPINSDPDDVDFKIRAEIYKETLKLETNFKEANFYYVNKTLNHPTEECASIGGLLDPFVDDWFEKNTGHSLPGLEFEGGIPIYKYRLIGIDKNAQDPLKCGCGYSMIYAPFVYIGGNECSRFAVHAAIHELGHTFGLCDEYDTCVWDETNEFELGAFGHPCLNSKPNDENSDCTNSCCSEGVACCLGKYAETKDSGFMNVMGSAEIPPYRKISEESRAVVDNFLCDTGGVC